MFACFFPARTCVVWLLFPPVTHILERQENRTRSFLCRRCYPELTFRFDSPPAVWRRSEGQFKHSSAFAFPFPADTAFGPDPHPRLAHPTYPAGLGRGGPPARARPPRAPSSRVSSAQPGAAPSPSAPPLTESGGGGLRLRLPPSCAPEPRRPRLTRPLAGGGADGGWSRAWRAGPGTPAGTAASPGSGTRDRRLRSAVVRWAGPAGPFPQTGCVEGDYKSRRTPRRAAVLARLSRANAWTSFPSGLQHAGSGGARLPGCRVG